MGETTKPFNFYILFVFILINVGFVYCDTFSYPDQGKWDFQLSEVGTGHSNLFHVQADCRLTLSTGYISKQCCSASMYILSMLSNYCIRLST